MKLPKITWGTLGGGGHFFFSEIQSDLVCELHEWHMQQPPPGALGGAKRSNIIQSELQSQFQRFLNHTYF